MTASQSAVHHSTGKNHFTIKDIYGRRKPCVRYFYQRAACYQPPSFPLSDVPQLCMMRVELTEPSARAEMTFPREDKDLLIILASSSTVPSAPVLPTFETQQHNNRRSKMMKRKFKRDQSSYQTHKCTSAKHINGFNGAWWDFPLWCI